MANDAFTLDFTADDVASKARTSGFGLIPNGVYPAAITGIELKEVKSGDNVGKPFARLEFTIQDGEFENRKVWANIMLFNLPQTANGRGGNWFISQFLKATGYGHLVIPGEGIKLPTLDVFEGKEVDIVVVQKNSNRKDDNGRFIKQNEISGFITDDDATTVTPTGRAKKNSLLP